MKVRFQADADFNEDIVKGVLRRVPEIDFQTAGNAGLEGIKDREVLDIAATQGRILVTHDRRTMPKHFGEFILEKECPGVFMVSKRADVREVIDAIVLIWAASEADEYRNSIIAIPF